MKRVLKEVLKYIDRNEVQQEDIAREFDITKRTVSNYIRKLKEILDDYGIKLYYDTEGHRSEGVFKIDGDVTELLKDLRRAQFKQEENNVRFQVYVRPDQAEKLRKKANISSEVRKALDYYWATSRGNDEYKIKRVKKG